MPATPTASQSTAATITEHELQQCRHANTTGLQPVVFVHGLWLLPSSWDRWAAFFEEAGYTALTPGWPDDPETVAEANAHPEVFAHKTVGQVADHFETIIRGLDRKPAVIGHSFGGLLAQILAGRGLAAATGRDRSGAVPGRAAAALLGAEIGVAGAAAIPPTATGRSRSPTTSSASASPTPSARTRPTSSTTISPCRRPVRRSSRRRPPTSIHGPRRRSTATIPSAGRS